MIKSLIYLGVWACLWLASDSLQAKTIRFCGREWIVRPTGVGGPGPNQWDDQNVWLDSSGYLHLKLAPSGGQWRCAEVYTQERLGFGRYQFWIEGRLDQLDPNVVFGLFNYPPADVGPDGTHEIDLEFARWGRAEAPVGNYTVWPAIASLKQTTQAFPLTYTGHQSTHRFIWSTNEIQFHSFAVLRAGKAKTLASWRFSPTNSGRIAQKPMPVHLNLWCFQGRPPQDGQPVEFVVRSFQFIPEGHKSPVMSRSRWGR